MTSEARNDKPKSWGTEMVETEREILREKEEEAKLGERKPFESSRQATYEDSVLPADDWEYEDS
jgi:hypothetical protein